MECNVCREALSARLDGEREATAAAAVEEHLEVCAACRAWSARAGAVTRTIRVRPYTETPDLVEAVLQTVPQPTRWAARRRVARAQWPRYALGLVAAAQVVLGVAQAFGADFGMMSAHDNGASMPAGADMSAHLFNESTAWNLAVGLGLLWVARRPRSAAGMLPVLGAFVVVLFGFVVHDTGAGQVTPSRVASHGLLLVGLVLLVVVHRRFGRPHLPSPDYSATLARTEMSVAGKAEPADPPHDPPGEPPPLCPVGRHVA